VAGEDGRAIRSVEQLAPGDKLRIHLIDGKAVVQIKEIEEKKGEGRF
jgi:exonuclease VII large subunit